MSLDLGILPIHDMGIKFIQKCKFPYKHIPEELECGSLAKLKTNFGSEYIVRVYPLNSSSFENCFMDSSVNIIINTNLRKTDDMYSIERVTDIDKLEVAKEKVESICVKVILNEEIFKHTEKIDLIIEDMVRDVLEPYYLMQNCCIKFDEEIRVFGLSKIIITSASSLFVFQIGPNTSIEIENIQMEIDNSIKLTELEGIEDNINELDEIMYNLKIQQDLKWKVKPSLNALIIGPTGSGKSSLCQNFILKYSCNVFIIKPSAIIRQYPGETEEVLRCIFYKATKFAEYFKSKDPTVIFVEDVELICPAKSSDSQDSAHINRICGQFCSLLDEIYKFNRKIIVLGTSTNVEMINSAIRRPGRFEKEISLSTLNELQREKIFLAFLRKSHWNIDDEKICSELSSCLAKLTPGFIAADILLLIQIVTQTEIRSSKRRTKLQPSYSYLKESFLSALKTIKPTSLKGSDISVYRCDQTFENLGGMDDLKRTLQFSVLAGLKHPEAFKRFALQLPKGILLYGPPGCAKTTIAKCLANQAKMTFISTSGAEVYSPYVGNAEKFISKIFDVARKNCPCLIFLDEIDTLVGNRSVGSRNDVQTRVLSTLLTEIDGIGLKIHSGASSHSSNNILVVAATNRPDMIDNALMRPGRFDKLIYVPPPDKLSRIAIFNIYKMKMPFDKDVNIEMLADSTSNFSGADICNLCNEAAMCAFTEDFNADIIKECHFRKVLEKMKSSLTEKQINWYCDFEKKFFS